jgi:hypothetical protein
MEHPYGDTSRRKLPTQRIKHTSEHTGQGLESLDWPLERNRLLESLFFRLWHEWTTVLATRDPLQLHATLPQASEQLVCRQVRKLAQGLDSPALNDRQQHDH